MITHKQFPNHKVYEMEIGGRPFTVETGKVAELANAEWPSPQEYYLRIPSLAIRAR